VGDALFGQSVRRVEDPEILRGDARFVADLPDDDALHVAIVRSFLAHATVEAVDTAGALACPGVEAVVTAADLGDANGPRRHPTWFPPSQALAEIVAPELHEEQLVILAVDRVRYSGAPVAAVLADDPYRAADAAELVSVDYRALPVVPDAEAALADGATLLHEEWGDNVSTRFRVRKGDCEAAFATAHTVVHGDFTVARQTGTPMEPRGVVAEFDGTKLTVWSSTQAPHWVRNALAVWTSLSPDDIRVVAPSVGGGFGIKSMVYPEEILLALLAIRTRRRLKWIETRSEHFLAAVHSRDQRHRISLALDADGRIVGLKDAYVVDAGASNLEALVVPYNTVAHLQGAYRVPALDVDCRCVVSNKSPLSAYRGAGRPEAVFAMERVLDLAARELGIDPLELRLRNLVGGSDMPYDAGIPYRDGSRLILDAGDVPRSLRVAAEAIDYTDWRARQQEIADEGGFVGVGMATYVEGTGIGPGETAQVTLHPSGEVDIVVALPSQGQGHRTVLAQICAERLGVDLEQVTVRQGDTALVAQGGGTIASRTVTVLGNSVAQASDRLREELLNEAADRLEASVRDIELGDGTASVRGAPQRSVPLTALVGDAGRTTTGVFEPPGVTFASGAHIAVVEVDPWTGLVHVLRYAAAHDCGRVVNPTIVDGQVVGGVAQGIGGALLEELCYDENGQLVTGSFMDYLVPRSTDMPPISVTHIETPSERNPLGVKGVGEAGTIAPPAAIAGAIEDALRSFGVTVTRCPMPPTEVAALLPLHALQGRSPASGEPHTAA
jgi:carbon-monoxide dehydrogenase large subunit